MADRPVRAEDHLTDFESMLWTLERDPTLTSGFANITFLDRPADIARMQGRMLRAAALIPQLRRRIFLDPARVAPPRWIDDPEFDIARHVHVKTLHDAKSEDVIDEAMAFCHRPYDPTHPLWEFLLLEGVSDGHGVMLQRFHHTISDGVGMVRISEHFIDFARNVDDPEPIALPEATPLPGTVSATRDALGHTLQRGVQSIQQGLATTSELLRDSERLLDGARRSLDVARSLLTETATIGKRQSPLWTQRSDQRTLRLLRVPFDDVRALAKRRGVTINDVFVAGAAGGAGAYHRAMGCEIESLRMAMPVSTRSDRSSAGNAFGTARVAIPVGPDPATRLGAIHERLLSVREGTGASLPQVLAGPANLLPAALLIQLTKAQVSTVDFTTSNVRGAPFPIYMAGALVESNHPIGPLIATACNLTTLSYNGSLDMGLHIDTLAIADPDLLARCTEEAFDELVKLR